MKEREDGEDDEDDEDVGGGAGVGAIGVAWADEAQAPDGAAKHEAAKMDSDMSESCGACGGMSFSNASTSNR